MGLFEVLLLSVGLAMDAFAVSVCKGLAAGKITKKEYILCGVWFGSFQGIMPLIGYLVGSSFEKLISIIAPWVAFFLLSLIGGNMIKEALGPDEEVSPGFDVKTMFMMAVATSIDALAVGVSLSCTGYSRWAQLAYPVTVIGLTSFLFTLAGYLIGIFFGKKYKFKPDLLGGIVLICIGTKVLLSHLYDL